MLATLGDCKQSLSLVGFTPDLFVGHPAPQGYVLATLGDCKQSLSLVGFTPDLFSVRLRLTQCLHQYWMVY